MAGILLPLLAPPGESLPPLGAGARRALSWPAWRTAHARHCAACRPGSPCDVWRVLRVLLAEGVAPGTLAKDAPRPAKAWLRRQRQHCRNVPAPRRGVAPRPYPLSGGAADEEFVAGQLADWVKQQVAVPASLSASAWAQAGGTLGPLFVVPSLRPVVAQLPALLAELRADPRGVLGVWRGDWCPAPSLSRVKRRLVADMRAANAAAAAPPAFRYPSVLDVVSMARPGGWLCAIDFAAGYHSVRLSEAARLSSGMLAPDGSVWHPQRLVFGSGAAPVLFCMISGEAMRLAVAEAAPEASCSEYVDDGCVFLPGGPLAEATTKARGILAVLRTLGWYVSAEKMQWPARAVDFLGLRVEITPAGVSLSVLPAKAALLALACEELLASRSAPRGSWATVVGKLTAAAPALTGGAWWLAPLYRLQGSVPWQRGRPATVIAVPDGDDPVSGVVPALRWFRAALAPSAAAGAAGGGGPMLFRAPRTFGAAVVAATDASGEGGLGGAAWGCVHATGATTALVFSEDAEAGPAAGAMAAAGGVDSSTGVELAAVALLLERLAEALPSDRVGAVFVEAFIDSQAAAAAQARGYSVGSPAVHAALGAVRQLALRHDLFVRPVWVRRERNSRADLLSHPESGALLVPQYERQLQAVLSAQAAREWLQQDVVGGGVPAGDAGEPA